ncbi:hypothetical protein JCM8097_008815 [Rhodosporidiobolus ruineniae]
MAALVPLADDPSIEDWDSDPDLDLPSGPLLLPSQVSNGLLVPQLNVSSASLSGSGSSAGQPSPSLSTRDEEDEEGGFFEHVGGDEGEWERTQEDENESSMDSSRTNTTTGTLKELMGGLSLAGDADTTLSFDHPPSSADALSASTSSSVTSVAETTPRAPSKMTTLRPGSSLSQLLALAPPSPSSPHRGKVHHLGSTRPGQATEVGDGDWDQDLDLGGLGLPVPAAEETSPRLNKKGSFASHLSLDSDVEDGFEFPSSSGGDEPRLRAKVSISSFSDVDDPAADDLDLAFDLPASTSHLTLAPLASRGSVSSLRSTGSSGLASAPPASPVPAKATLPIPAAASPAPSSPGPLTPSKGGSSSDDDGTTTEREQDDDDDDFFADLVLPSYLGGEGSVAPGALSTPPTSEGEPSDSDPWGSTSPEKTAPSPNKVDLQSLLRAKLEQRGGRGLLFHESAPASPPVNREQDERLKKHREPVEDPSGRELARELAKGQSAAATSVATKGKGKARESAGEEDEAWTAREMRERMRTISGARAKEAQLAKEARLAAKRGGGLMRRRMSESKIPPLPTNLRRPPLQPTRSATASAAPSSSSRLGRPSSAQGGERERPPSVLSNASSSGQQTSTRRGPPPAPSAASRDRVRMRTTSLRTVGSSSDLRSGAAKGGRPAKLDVSAAGASRGSTTLSPVPMTPATPSTPSTASSGSAPVRPSPGLRTKRSQQHLSSAAAVAAGKTPGTMERKRSLQNLSTTAASSGRPSSRQSLRSPSPANAASTSSRLPSFAAPTASSSSRVRERVQSNPSALSIPSTPTTPSLASSSAAFGLSPSTTTTSTTRLLRPTVASAIKARPSSSGGPSSRPTSPMKGGISPHSPTPAATSRPTTATGLRIPSAPLTLSTPLSRPPSGATAFRSRRSGPTSAAFPPKPKEYGDGTELDGFDDLPVSKEREKEGVVTPRSSSAAGVGGGGSRKSSAGSTATVKGGSWGRKGGASKLPRPAPGRREGSAGSVVSIGEVRGKKEGEAAVKAEKERSKAKEGKGKKEKEGAVGEKKEPKKKRREPHLIRHLGGAGAGIKVQNGMTYNPLLHRWEGNESILREFDVALATSTRPALISPFSSTLGSPARGSFDAPNSASSSSNPHPLSGVDQPSAAAVKGSSPSVPAGAGTSRAGIKVVGDMVFDPTTCSWHAVAGPDAEDELELDWGDGAAASAGETADDEEEGGAAERGERERWLRNRASFVLEEGESSEEGEDQAAASEAEGEEGAHGGEGKRKKSTKRRMWRESTRAEERCKVEMAGWIVKREEGEQEEDSRRWMWELRALIMDTR